MRCAACHCSQRQAAVPIGQLFFIRAQPQGIQAQAADGNTLLDLPVADAVIQHRNGQLPIRLLVAEEQIQLAHSQRAVAAQLRLDHAVQQMLHPNPVISVTNDKHRPAGIGDRPQIMATDMREDLSGAYCAVHSKSFFPLVSAAHYSMGTGCRQAGVTAG